MAYDKSDPRAALAAPPGKPLGTEDIAAPELWAFADRNAATKTDAGSATWAARGQNFVLAYTELAAGDELIWEGDRGYVVIAPVDDAQLEVSCGGETVSLEGRGIVVVPPGRSTVTSSKGGVLGRMFEGEDEAAAALAANANSYSKPHPRVALTPERPQPEQLKAYRVADYPPEQGRFGTIFRTNQLMINFLDDTIGPRDPEKLSPHHHDDFEQGSFTIQGDWQHHIRTPWTTKQSQWREDDHFEVSGPSLTIIPPPTIHTSQGVGLGTNIMIDLFAPPRDDFAEKGWVVNAEDFPL